MVGLQYVLYLLIDLTTNSILYSDNIVSHKSHNNGKLDLVVTLIITITSNLISLLLDHYLSFLRT